MSAGSATKDARVLFRPLARWVLPVILAGMCGAFWLVFGAPWNGSDVSPRATPSAIRALTPGLTEAETEAILGKPWSTQPNADETEWRFSRDVPRVYSFPRVRLFFKGGVLERIVVDRMDFWGVDRDSYFVRDADGVREFHGGIDAAL